ncbi:MAG: HAD family phosphatase [Bacteroidetes bacterium]|jgi:HAD superfamily hydrolase (TIGR01509 family)|nr:HAD family phosphatase [Bacteroidota bacterium]MBT4402188.1 HAD family phosphatase [Bacteroidota bacterium]MBT4410868.1 HAD family phosphatase [Bacteroidota bacterium]MBT5425661.1 HAD family phosphatase [Bacteroidota bacterium]MBT7094528.1 HAD family phosphatase [Bacteroidota bacterium]
MLKPYTALLLDLDGLLIDSEKVYHEVAYKMTEKLGKVLTKDIITKQMGRSPYESLGIYRRELGIKDYSTKELVDWRDEGMMEAYRISVDMMPGGMELLKNARDKYKMAIATGSTRNLVDIVVEKLGLDAYMQHIQPSDEIVNGKPHPEIFLECASQLEEDPTQCIVLEDSSNGCLAGKKAGCFVIAVPSEYTDHQDFGMADVLVKDLFEAWDVIVGL